jgi:hypothetical protein
MTEERRIIYAPESLGNSAINAAVELYGRALALICEGKSKDEAMAIIARELEENPPVISDSDVESLQAATAQLQKLGNDIKAIDPKLIARLVPQPKREPFYYKHGRKRKKGKRKR